ncbi:phosphoribosylglycinamide formyltransferase [Candidatus Velamenicoccus archaeovorus]|nr:phosphoribosylglycinamide formyltransferase [Candidatus Velamenicoccus archaeovorus]
MKTIAVFVSGNGTNLQAIMNAVVRGALKARIALVVSDKKDAFALKRARRAGISTLFLDPKDYRDRRAYDAAVLRHLKAQEVDLIVLAGFMRILSPSFVRAYRNRILNIHPALLPAFPGERAIKDAFRYGVGVTGVTVHFVDEEVDHGPIIVQEPVRVLATDTMESLEKKIHKVEHRIYPEAIKKVLSGGLILKGRRVLPASHPEKT